MEAITLHGIKASFTSEYHAIWCNFGHTHYLMTKVVIIQALTLVRILGQ